SFSNRMFFQKAIQVWRDGSEAFRVELVKSYFRSVPGATKSKAFNRETVKLLVGSSSTNWKIGLLTKISLFCICGFVFVSIASREIGKNFLNYQ
ncbi:MAG: hypothetical protein ACKPE1_09975, partial [Dolichospermum sp.]